jgi:hypothetical protein
VLLFVIRDKSKTPLTKVRPPEPVGKDGVQPSVNPLFTCRHLCFERHMHACVGSLQAVLAQLAHDARTNCDRGRCLRTRSCRRRWARTWPRCGTPSASRRSTLAAA